MAARFSIESTADPFWPGEVITLADREALSWARVVPDAGGNLVAFGAELAGRSFETFLQPTDERPSLAPAQYGAPVLYPFPNRLRAGQAAFGGRAIRVDRPAGQPHAIHGLVREKRWQVIERRAAADGALLRCAVESDPDTLRQFPFPFRLELAFHLRGTVLRVEAVGQNTGADPMPMGFGWHPYFRLPLVAGTERARTEVRVPARRQWQLDPTLVPTGEIIPVPADRDFRTRRPIGSVYLDDVYTDLERDDGHSVCELRDPATGLRLRVSAGPTFREWVVYAPPTRPTICFEPYTCPTDAFNLAARGRDVGLIVLGAGERWSDWMELAVELS